MAHIRKLGKGRWQARYVDPTGRMRSRNFPRESEAKQFLVSVEKDKLLGDWFDPDRGQTQFQVYADKWVQTKLDVRPRTLINIEGRIQNHLIPAFGERAIGSIRPDEVRTWVSELTRSDLSPATVRAIYLVFSQIMKTATIDRYISRSPCVGVSLPPLGSHEEMHFLSAEEVRLLAETITPQFRTLIYTAAYMGLRAGELLGLRLERINLLHGSLHVSVSLSEVRGQLQIGPTKTGRPRTLLIPRFWSRCSATK